MKNPTISPNSVLKAINRDRIFREMDGESIILNIETGAYCGLNRVGTRIWRILQKPVSVAGIQATLLREYDVDPQQCEREVSKLLEKMIELKIVGVHDETDT